MALNTTAIEQAYKVLQEIKSEVLPDLAIPSWPMDMAKLSDEDRIDPPLNEVMGFDRKADNGWENLFFLVKKPSPELITLFTQLKPKVPNTGFAKVYAQNDQYWILGWF
ncbi:hypothetical protein [Pedobacter sp. Leaf250]|uniref:hypothetical protein n=1 Tax=Pedobacter sp. Leaf250 TaxID=2876559 RepID=UPI001E43B055|nr:hypothetical protein [Pedobacter sp. Leaf250]